LAQNRAATPSHLEARLLVEDADRADVAALDAAAPAQHRQQPLRIGVLAATDVAAEPHPHRPFAGAGAARRPPLAGIAHVLGDRALLAPDPRQQAGDLLRCLALQQQPGDFAVLLADRLGELRIGEEAVAIEVADRLGARRRRPLRHDARFRQQPFRLLAPRRRHQQAGDALAAGPPGAARAVLEHLAVVRQIGVDDQIEIGQIDAARRHVGRHAHPSPAVAQRLQRLIAFVLAEFAGERHRLEAAFDERRQDVAHRLAGVGEDDRRRRLVIAQQIDDRRLDLLRHHPDRPMLDVGVAALAARHRDAQGVALIARRQLDDRLRQGRREQQRQSVLRRLVEDELEILAEAHVEHLVGLVEHHRLERRDVEPAAFDVVAQAPRRADDDVGAERQPPPFGARIHAADARDDARLRLLEQPGELALDLQRQFARRRDHQGTRSRRRREGLALAEQIGPERQPVGDGLAGSGLRRDDEVAPARLRRQHGGLHRGRFVIGTMGERAVERRAREGKSQGMCSDGTSGRRGRRGPRLGRG